MPTEVLSNTASARSPLIRTVHWASAGNERRRHIPSLDGVRGIAICLVFLFHYYPRQPHDPISLLASIGWVGVDVFFVLSGFLITGILFDTLDVPHSLRKFFARRSLRLFPVYIVMILLLILFAKPLRIPLSWKYIPFLAYGANLSDALGIRPSFGPFIQLRHLWSLAIEEQFYLLWAPLVFVLAKRRKIMVACGVGIFAAALLRVIGVFTLPPAILYEGLLTRMDALLSGALLAMVIRGERPGAWMSQKRLSWIFSVGIAITGISFVLSHSFFITHPFTIIFGYAGNDLWCVALLGLALLPGTVLYRWLKRPALRFIGRYSYGLYLWHQIPAKLFLKFLSKVQGLFHPMWLSGFLGTALLFGFCLLMAMASYHAIELPFLRLKRHFSYAVGRSAMGGRLT